MLLGFRFFLVLFATSEFMIFVRFFQKNFLQFFSSTAKLRGSTEVVIRTFVATVKARKSKTFDICFIVFQVIFLFWFALSHRYFDCPYDNSCTSTKLWCTFSPLFWLSVWQLLYFHEALVYLKKIAISFSQRSHKNPDVGRKLLMEM